MGLRIDAEISLVAPKTCSQGRTCLSLRKRRYGGGKYDGNNCWSVESGDVASGRRRKGPCTRERPFQCESFMFAIFPHRHRFDWSASDVDSLGGGPHVDSLEVGDGARFGVGDCGR